MDILYRGHHTEYQPPQVNSTKEVLSGTFRGHHFRVRKQARVNLAVSPYKMRYRGH